uniref:Mycbp associated protein n=1 Tax=Astyanax mexicanus TaxID=7994 RepID=W5K4Y5_ASTMX
SSVSEEQISSSILKGDDIQALAIKPDHLEMIRAPQPPKEPLKPRLSSRVLVRKTRPCDEVRKGVSVSVARPLLKDATLEPLEYTPGGPRFDEQGMVLPHSILGSLEDFRREMEDRGETELVSRIPDQKTHCPLQAGAQQRNGKIRTHKQGGWDPQGHALQHWNYHMAERRRQQNFIALLEKPVEELLMNQSNRYREIQEQREIISRGLPALHPGHGRRVGSEFWSVPQRFGDELSGITATLTQTQKGNPPPITRITQPLSARRESNEDGVVSRAWSQSQYLHYRQHELRDILTEMDYNQPDPLEFYDDVMMEVELIPALRLCGELACWTGNATSNEEEVGVAVRLLFEAAVGESVSSELELKNEGSTAVYYSWHRLAAPPSFTHTRAQRHSQNFYFNTATEVWQLHTHPVLLGGASLQVTLRGVALYQDKTAEKRAAIELHYHSQPVEALKRLWEEAHRLKTTTAEEHQQTPAEIPTWDLCMDHLRQLQMWRELCDGLVSEAVRLRLILGLPENNTWGDNQTDQDNVYVLMERMVDSLCDLLE